MTDHAPHTPVLLEDVVKALAPKDGGAYVDGTFGNGGYTRAILDAAVKAFQEEGFDNASMDRIAEMADASKRTVRREPSRPRSTYLRTLAF